ncbi:MAG: hypothetical protein ACXWXY_10185 [Aeromicrobium sp.]
MGLTTAGGWTGTAVGLAAAAEHSIATGAELADARRASIASIVDFVPGSF